MTLPESLARFGVKKTSVVTDNIPGTNIKKQKYLIRKPPLFDFEAEYRCCLIQGMKRKGKSVLGERCAEDYLEHGYLVFDLFDSGDYENCYWVVRRCANLAHGPFKYDEDVCPVCGAEPQTDYRILLVHSDDAEVTVKDPRVKPVSADFGLEKIVRTALAENRIICIARRLFDPVELDYLLAKWITQWQELNTDVFRTDTLFLIREAASIVFSRGKIRKSQGKLKAVLGEFIRQAGHVRTAVIFDTQRSKEVDMSVRGHLNTRFIKRHITNDMPDVIEKLNDRIKKQRKKLRDGGKSWNYINRHRPEITYLLKNEFYALFDDGSYELYRNGMPKFHHKGEKDYFMDFVGMTAKRPQVCHDTKSIHSIRQVPSRALRRANYLLDQAGIDPDIRADVFERSVATVKRWVKEYEEQKPIGDGS